MFVISTRNFPPEVGGIQSLMGGLSVSLLKHGPVKVFAENFDDFEKFDKNSGLDITRVAGFKIFRKYRKANLVKEFSLYLFLLSQISKISSNEINEYAKNIKINESQYFWVFKNVNINFGYA